jgi:PHD/YefM family antitoxin component YafN of YafNO toxin-antitoxin module
MKTISAKEAKNSFGAFLDSAQREPVMVTKRDRPVGMFFSMHDLNTLLNVGDAFKKEIYEKVAAGIDDADAGRVRECNAELAEELKAKLRAKLATVTN